MRVVSQNQAKGRRVPGYTAQERAVLAAVERRLAAYIHMDCDHYSTVEEQLMWAHAKPKGKKFWCDKCSQWRGLYQWPKPPGHDSPIPLF